MRESVVEGLKPPPEAIAREVADYRGGWLLQMAQRTPKAVGILTATLISWAFWRVGGVMLTCKAADLSWA